MAMARRGRRPRTSRAVTVAVPAITTERLKRQCRNITLTSITVLNHERPLLPATPSLDYSSSYVLDENLDSVVYLSLDKDAGSLANVETDRSRDSGTSIDRE
jgi:thiazole synthase ThiGH ThiG subunit